MKIYDCFTYYNEADMVQIRFEELKDVVDYFVVVESSQTFTGKPKPFYFDDLPDWVDKWKEKIIRIKVNFPKELETSWEREFFQRNAISQIVDRLDDSDVVIISDADEIVKSSLLENITEFRIPARIDVRQYFWNFNWRVPPHCDQGARPVVCAKHNLKNNTPQELRGMTLPVIPDGGWHFSFFGQSDKIKNKIESFAHTEYDSEEYKNSEAILYRIKNGIDPFDRFPLKYYWVDGSYPRCILPNYQG
jgi:beta-1,4-mannosyl-glycoprotein beta-1,4-N-acetylglucosaminyltransferase